MKISVFIIAKNEEKNIERCLRSVTWADEIVLVDSESTDRTREIAARFTDKVFTNPFADYASQKNFALAKTSADWVLLKRVDGFIPTAFWRRTSSVLPGLTIRVWKVWSWS